MGLSERIRLRHEAAWATVGRSPGDLFDRGVAELERGRLAEGGSWMRLADRRRGQVRAALQYVAGLHAEDSEAA